MLFSTDKIIHVFVCCLNQGRLLLPNLIEHVSWRDTFSHQSMFCMWCFIYESKTLDRTLKPLAPSKNVCCLLIQIHTLRGNRQVDRQTMEMSWKCQPIDTGDTRTNLAILLNIVSFLHNNLKLTIDSSRFKGRPVHYRNTTLKGCNRPNLIWYVIKQRFS